MNSQKSGQSYSKGYIIIVSPYDINSGQCAQNPEPAGLPDNLIGKFLLIKGLGARSQFLSAYFDLISLAPLPNLIQLLWFSPQCPFLDLLHSQPALEFFGGQFSQSDLDSTSIEKITAHNLFSEEES